MMKTVVCQSPGDLQLVERPLPQAAEGEVLLRVRRIGLCGTDMHIFRGTQPFLQYPRGTNCRAKWSARPSAANWRPATRST